MPDEQTTLDQSKTTGTDTAEAVDQTSTDTVADATTDDKGKTEQTGDQPAPDGQKQDFIGEVPKELEPLKKEILKKYFSKTRELAEERRGVDTFKKDAETLQQLMAYKPFQDWYSAQKNGGTSPDKPSLTEEELEAIRNDPSKFDSFLNKKLESLIESRYGQQMKSFQEKAEDIEVAKEYNGMAESKHGEEFKLAHESGELDAYYDKGLDYKTAYATWKLDNGNFVSSGEMEKVTGEKAVQMVNKSKLSATEKPSSGGGKLPNIKVIKGKQNFNDTFDAFMEAAMKGEKVKIDKN